MSENAGSIYTELRIKLDKLEQDLKKAKSELKELDDTVEGTGKKVEGVGKKFKKMGSQLSSTGKKLTRNVTVPLMAIGTAAVIAGTQFATAMAKVEAITGATSEEFETLNSQAKELGLRTQFSAKQAASGMEFLARAGFEVNEIYDAMPGMLDLAAAAAMDLGRAADITSNIMRAFQMEATESGHIADVLAEAAANANTDVEMLGEAMKYAAPVAQGLGISMEETAAFISKLGDAGIQASMAGTTLRRGLINLAGGSAEVKNTLAELGVEIFDERGKMKSLAEVVDELRTGLEGYSDQAKTTALSSIFGARAVSGWMTIINGGTNELRDFTLQLENADGAAKTMAETMLDNVGGSLTLLKSSLEGAGIAITEALTPAIRAIAGALTEMLNAFSRASEGFQIFIVAVGAIAAAIGPLLFIAGQLTIAWGAVAPVLGTVAGILGGPFTIAILGVLGALGMLVAYTERVNAAEKEHIENQRDLLDQYNELKGKANLSADEKERLKDVSERLALIYPDLVTGINNETEALELNTEALENQVTAYERLGMKKEAEERVRELARQTTKMGNSMVYARDNIEKFLGIFQVNWRDTSFVTGLQEAENILKDLDLENLIPEDGLSGGRDLLRIENAEEFKAAMTDASEHTKTVWGNVVDIVTEFEVKHRDQLGEVRAMEEEYKRLNAELEVEKQILEEVTKLVNNEITYDQYLKNVEELRGTLEDVKGLEEERADIITEQQELYDEMANKRAQVNLGELPEEAYVAWLEGQLNSDVWQEFPRVRERLANELERIQADSLNTQSDNAAEARAKQLAEEKEYQQALVTLGRKTSEEYKAWLEEMFNKEGDEEGGYHYSPETRAQLKDELDQIAQMEEDKRAEIEQIVSEHEFAKAQLMRDGLQQRIAELDREEAEVLASMKDASEEQLQVVRDRYEAEREIAREEAEKQKELFNQEWGNKLALQGMEGLARDLEEIRQQEEAELQAAREAGQETAAIEQYYLNERERIKEEYAQRSIDFQQQWENKLVLLHQEGVEKRLTQLEIEKEQAIADAEQRGEDTTAIEQYYQDRKTEIEREAEEERAAIVQKYVDKRDLLGREGLDRELRRLEIEKQEAIQAAEEKGAEIAEIEAYYNDLMEEAKRESEEAKAKAVEEWANKNELLAIEDETQKLIAQYEQQREAALETAQTKEEIAEINEYYNSMIVQAERDYAQQITDIHTKLANDVRRLGMDRYEAQEFDVNQRAGDYLMQGADPVQVAEWVQAQMEKINEERVADERRTALEIAKYKLDTAEMTAEEYIALIDEQLAHEERYSNRWIQLQREKASVLEDSVMTAMEELKEQSEEMFDNENERSEWLKSQLEALKAKYEDNLAIVELINEELEKMNSNTEQSGWDKMLEAFAGGDITGGIIQALEMVAEEMKSVFAQLGEDIIGSLEGVAGAVGQGILSMAQGDITGGIAQVFMAIAEESEHFQTLLAGINEAIMAFVEPLIPVLDAIFKALEPLLDPLTRIMEVIGESLAKLLESLVPIITALVEALAPLLELLAPIIQIITNILNTLMKVLLPIIKFFAKVLQGVVSVIMGVINGFINLWNSTLGMLFGRIDTVGNTSTTTYNPDLKDDPTGGGGGEADTRSASNDNGVRSDIVEKANLEMNTLVRGIRDYIELIYERLDGMSLAGAVATSSGSRDISLKIDIQPGAVQVTAEEDGVEEVGTALADIIADLVLERLQEDDLAEGRA